MGSDRKAINKFLLSLSSLREEENLGQESDNLWEVFFRILIPKKINDEEVSISSFLTDIRAIPRVTIVSSQEISETETDRTLLVKCKFNTKKMENSGFYQPSDFVGRFLTPSIQNLEINPKILAVSEATQTMSKTQFGRNVTSF